MNEKSIFALFQVVCDENPDKVAYRHKDGDTWIPLTWKQSYDINKRIAKSLIALGVQKGDKVNILSHTRLEWSQCDLATVSIGAVTVGIYPTNLADECAYIINHSEGVVLFVENREQLEKVLSVRNDLPKLRHIIIIDGSVGENEPAMTWQQFWDKADETTEKVCMERTEAVQPEDLATIVYTSGTTGVPKGAMLTHNNILFSSWNVCECLPINAEMETVMFLPLAHIFARLTVYSAMRARLIVAFAQSVQTLVEDIKEVQPHFFASAPRVYEKIYEKVTSDVQLAGGMKKKIFDWALATGYAVSKLLQNHQPIPGGLRIKNSIAHKLVFSKLHKALGGRIQTCVSGAAPLNKDIAEFFHAFGILILEGIGMTENTSFTNVNRVDRYKFGSVGLLGDKIEEKLAEDGELLCRGPHVMAGYYKDPEGTAEAIDEDGWLHTGDICTIDNDGFLYVTDRKKDLIITSGGKNIAPQRIERIIRSSHFVSQVLAIGDKRKFVSALVSLNRPDVEIWATQHGMDIGEWDEFVQTQAVQNLIQSEIDRCNRELASYETVKKFRIIPHEFSIDSGEMTPTLKLKRNVITANYKSLIDSMYEGV